ncbi:MAG: asparaginase domain-containing protein, partial [Nanobdellota archaeon]
SEVMTCMHATSNDDYCLLIRGTRVRKMHTSRRDAFRPINSKPLAKVYPNGIIEVVDHDYAKRKETKCKIFNKFEGKTALLYIYPNFDPNVISYYSTKDFKGLVIGATALGHVNSDGSKNVLPMIKNAIDAGIIVVIASQTIYGSTHKYVYSNLRKLSIQLGCEFAGDCPPEMAYVKLGWSIANSKSKSEAKEIFRKNISGEFSQRSAYETFLN